MSNQRIKINPDLHHGDASPLNLKASAAGGGAWGGSNNNNNNNNNGMSSGFYADVNSPIASTPNLKHLRNKKDPSIASLPSVPASVATTNAVPPPGGAGSTSAPSIAGEEMEGWTTTLFSPVLKLFGGGD